ncbi:MAG: alcohol dehydrogenase catalytic domain-containing protein [Verrucomicrobia bacterium]|nr:alcohol dehydrogenase catalytic domain-containing protein [Verrucomicrobiota bacterium]
MRVEACGVCHSDAATVDGLFAIKWPRVPGHEVVGKIDALGSGVQGWTVANVVGVGFLAGSCSYCEFCRNGDLVNCKNQEFTGIHHDGGYAEVMIAKASALVSIPRKSDLYWPLGVVVGDAAAAGGGCSLRVNMRNLQASPSRT